MKVIAIEKGFYKGDLIKAGTEFEFTGEKIGKWMAPVGKQVEKPKGETDEGPTAKEIRAQLSQAGVQFKANASKTELLELLKATIDKVAPGSSTADKDLREKTDEVP